MDGWIFIFLDGQFFKVEYIGVRKIIILKQLSISLCADKLSLVKNYSNKSIQNII